MILQTNRKTCKQIVAIKPCQTRAQNYKTCWFEPQSLGFNIVGARVLGEYDFLRKKNQIG